jgi:hypothetical protein
LLREPGDEIAAPDHRNGKRIVSRQGPPVKNHRARILQIVVDVHAQGDAEAFHVRHADDLLGLVSRPTESGNQDGDEQGDNGNHDPQLDEGGGMLPLHSSCLPRRPLIATSRRGWH